MSEGDVPELPSVLVVGGMIDGHDVKLNPGLTLIVGSGRLANLRLDHPDIELAHIKIRWDELGISMVDNGSRKGTWVNGEPVETAGLLDGDVITFVPPNYKGPAAPKVKLRIPKGSVPDPPPLPPPAPGEVAGQARCRSAAGGEGPRSGAPQAERVPHARRRPAPARARRRRAPAAAPRRAGSSSTSSSRSRASRRSRPPQVEMGQTLTLTGTRFARDPADNKVWFGNRSAVPTSGTRETLEVRVPMLSAPGPVSVSVETPIGRSRSLPIIALAPLRVTSIDPAGALPGDEVVLGGNGFADGLTRKRGRAGRDRREDRAVGAFASRCRSWRERPAASTR